MTPAYRPKGLVLQYALARNEAELARISRESPTFNDTELST